MPSPEKARRSIKIDTAKACSFLDAALEKLRDHLLVETLTEIGEAAIAESQATHEYKNQTGAGEASHDFSVVAAGHSESMEFFGPKGHNETVILTSPDNEVTLFLAARQHYLFWVEVKNGFSVLRNTVLRLQSQASKIIGSKLRTKKLF